MYSLTGQGVTPYNRGGMIVRSAAAGTILDITTTQNASCIPYVVDVFDNDTSARVIAIGLEIHNTTAEINKQGSIITYRVSDEPCFYPVTPTLAGATVTTGVTNPGVELVEPPNTAGKAVDLPGSLQWDAAKGAYVVPVFNCEDNKPQDLRDLIPVTIDNNTTLSYTELISLSSSVYRFSGSVSSNAMIPMSLSGCYLTGLSPETTLTCNLTYYIEQFPSFASALHRVSSPSCPEDFAALELYTKIARVIPTGVEVNDNFLGAFVSGISRIATQVARYAPTVMKYGGMAYEAYKEFESMSSTPTGSGGMNGLSRISNNPAQNSKQIVVYEPPRNSSKQIIVRDDNEKEVITIRNNSNSQQKNSKSRRRPRGQTVKNKRDPTYNRLDKYIKASNAGNRYLL